VSATDAPIPWRAIVRFALVGAVLVAAAVLIENERSGNGNPVSLINPGADGPSAAAVEADFPDLELPPGLGHDGQQFYAIARDPFPPKASAPYLDRPRYRLQRPLYPWLAWLLHPTGGGTGLIFALFAVGFAATVLGGVAMGGLVASTGGPAWSALLFAAMPGVYASLRISTADVLALALGLAAVLALRRHRTALACGLAIAAVLAREPTFLLLAGVAVARRDRPSLLMTGSAAVLAAAWAAYLRLTVDVTGEQVMEFVVPFEGWLDGLDRWGDGTDLWACAAFVAAVGAGVLALWFRRSGPWTWAIAIQLAFLSVLDLNVIGLDFNGTRTTMPLLAISLIALLERPAVSPGAR
jgi:hypothetical protein